MVEDGQPVSIPQGDRHSWGRLELKDALLLLGLGAILLVYVHRYVDFSVPTFEDAAMLMRYAQHLAGGHGIVWNVGERPVDGATDFLFVVAIAGLVRVGFSVFAAVRLLGLVSHALTVFLIYLAVRKLQRSSPWVAFFSATYLAIGLGFRYIEAYFGTPFFALAATISFWFAMVCLREPESEQAIVGFALASLVLGLIRPDGVFMAALMLLGLIFAIGFRKSRKLVIQWMATYAVLGGAYFLWHWHYFGYPLPNAFYVKGGGHLHIGGLEDSVSNVIHLNLPFLPVYVLGIFSSRRTRREAIFALIPIVGFTAIWILLSSEMNFAWRFQYAVLPLVLMSWSGLLAHAWEDWHFPSWHSLSLDARWRASALLIIACAFVLLWQFRASKSWSVGADCNFNIALTLENYQGKGYGMATTEPGILPLYSNWRALDTYGLNDQALAHGADLDDVLDRFHPQLIHLHLYSLNNAPDTVRFYLMTHKLKRYAEQKGYRLALAFGSRDNIYCYYVQPGFPDSDEILQRIRSTWETDPKQTFDFDNFKEP
jgi:hypothetical protein